MGSPEQISQSEFDYEEAENSWGSAFFLFMTSDKCRRFMNKCSCARITRSNATTTIWCIVC